MAAKPVRTPTDAAKVSILPAPRCHLYLRVSSPDQDLDVGPDGRPVRVRRTKDDREREVKRSLDTQEAEGRAYAERMGYHVADSTSTGRSTPPRRSGTGPSWPACGRPSWPARSTWWSA